MELLYICDLKGEWFDFIYTFSQLLPGLVAGAFGRHVLCGVAEGQYWPRVKTQDSISKIYKKGLEK